MFASAAHTISEWETAILWPVFVVALLWWVFHISKH